MPPLALINSLPSFGFGLALGLLVAAVATTVLGRWSLRKHVELERRAADAERLAELGMLTGGLAHEIKNPLSTLQLNLQLLREEIDERSALLAAPTAGGDVEERRKVLGRMGRRLDSVGKEANRLREILDDFLRYAGRLEPERQPTRLDELAGELADFLAPQVQMARLKFETRLAPVTAAVDAKLVKQALLNLLLNAIQHTPEGGTITLSIAEAERLPRRPRAAILRVGDTGRGISRDEVARVFDPYFTRRKGGTGLGLALTRRIARAHGGTIDVESEPGQGATFELRLPTSA